MTMAAPHVTQDVLLNKESMKLEDEKTCFECKDFNLYYAAAQALKDINLTIPEKRVTAFIGPSGHGEDINSKSVNVAELRRKVGMVFQKPNPFPKTIYENVAYGLRLQGVNKKRVLDERVEWALKGAALWGEVKDRLQDNALGLSGGQQQRLVIARAIAIQPEVILLDEPASALDPISTLKIEELIIQLKEQYTVVIVTHNMQQAARVSDYTAFLYLGELIEFGATDQLFTNPNEKKTEDYITGRYG